MSINLQIFETIDLGLITLDTDLRISGWNRWMELHSNIRAEEIIGSSLIDLYPSLAAPKYTRLFKSVLNFGNYACFSQKLHKFLIPLKNPHNSREQLPHMQQNCTANPLRDDQGVITGMFIAVHDVTEYVTFEMKLLEMTKLDPLTRLFNRSHLEKRFSEEIERAKRHGNTFSIIMLDIDHFKTINDTRGHLCGDYTLRQLAGILQHAVRSLDVVGRYGGEEFCCILPETDLEQAAVLGERLREQVENSPFSYMNERYSVTISLGLSEYGPGGTSLETLIDSADQALYQAKRSGRNRVVRSAAPLMESNDD